MLADDGCYTPVFSSIGSTADSIQPNQTALTADAELAAGAHCLSATHVLHTSMMSFCCSVVTGCYNMQIMQMHACRHDHTGSERLPQLYVTVGASHV